MATHPKLIRQKPLDVWTVKEKLMLASSVLQSGDQNWVSVSRAIRNQASQPRPPEYFSQKNCALQYGALLEKADTPKRKRSEKNEVVETPGMQIVRKLTIDYMEELRQTIKQQQEQHYKLSDEIEMVNSGHCDGQLAEIWEQIQKKQREKEQVEDKKTAASVEESSQSNSTPASQPSSTPVSQSDSTPASQPISTTVSQPISNPVRSLLPSSIDTDDNSTQDSQEAVIEVDDQSQDVPSSNTFTYSNQTTSQQSNDLSQSDFQSQPQSTGAKTHPSPNITSGAEVVKVTNDTAQEPAAVVKIEPASTTQNLESIESNVVSETRDINSKPDTSSKPTSPQKLKKADNQPPVPEMPVTPDKATKLQETEPDTPSVPETERPLSPASSISNVSDAKSAKQDFKASTPQHGTPHTSLRRSNRVSKPKDDKKEETTSTGVSKSASEVDLTSDDDDNNEEKAQPSNKSVESPPNSPTISVQGENEDDRYHKSWKKSIMMVWRSVSHHKFANVFMHQVTDDIAPRYSSCVFRPMSLSLIKQNIEKNVIKTTEEFTRDMMLMFINAIMYNNHEYDVYSMAQDMYEETMKAIEQHKLNIGKELDAKPVSLRGRRSEDLEKSKRRSSVDQQADPVKKRKTRADD